MQNAGRRARSPAVMRAGRSDTRGTHGSGNVTHDGEDSEKHKSHAEQTEGAHDVDTAATPSGNARARRCPTGRPPCSLYRRRSLCLSLTQERRDAPSQAT
jgi:hypothetical protein